MARDDDRLKKPRNYLYGTDTYRSPVGGLGARDVSRSIQKPVGGGSMPIPGRYSPSVGGRRSTSPRPRMRNVGGGLGKTVNRVVPKAKKNYMPTPGIYTPRGAAGLPSTSILDPFSDMPSVDSLSFEDALSQARGIIGDSGLKDALSIISGRESAIKGQANDSTARINAMYKQLEDSLRQDAPGIENNATSARNAIDSTASASQAAAKEAYAATQAAQAELRNRLGTQDAEIYEAATGNQDADIYQADVERSNARRENTSNEITRNAQAAKDRLTGDIAAVGLEGRSQASGIQNQLMGLLAQLQDERSQTTNEYNRQAQQAALALAQDFVQQSQQQSGNRYQQWLDRQRLMRDDANTAWEQGMAENQFALETQQAQARNQPQAPDLDNFSPMAQWNYQQAQNLGPQNAGKAASAIAKHATFINGKPGVNAQRAIQELVAAGFTPQQAQQAVNDYLLIVG